MATVTAMVVIPAISVGVKCSLAIATLVARRADCKSVFAWPRKGRKVAKKKPGKKPTRGSGVSVTLPTEPLAGNAKTTPIMAVMVQDDGTPILEYEIKEGQSIQFRVGGTVRAFMERLGPAPDGDMFLDADSGNVEPVVPSNTSTRCPARR